VLLFDTMVFEVHPHGSSEQCFVIFRCSAVPYRVGHSLSVHPLMDSGAFPFFDYYN
jgi:hypothetical protein